MHVSVTEMQHLKTTQVQYKKMVRNKYVLSRKMELNTAFDTSNTRDIVFSHDLMILFITFLVGGRTIVWSVGRSVGRLISGSCGEGRGDGR